MQARSAGTRRRPRAALRDSQFNLGVLLTRGMGTPRNLPRAYQWFDVAARQGDADAAAKRNEIAKRLAPPELAAAKLLAERWRARPTDNAANEVELDPPATGRPRSIRRSAERFEEARRQLSFSRFVGRRATHHRRGFTGQRSR